MSEELKPCPFCGGEAKEFTGEDAAPHRWTVECDSCGAHVGSDTRHKARAKWNRRAGTTCEQRRTRRVCYVESSHVEWERGEYSYLEVELSCGHAFTWDDVTPPDYCPYCGARIIREETGDAD